MRLFKKTIVKMSLTFLGGFQSWSILPDRWSEVIKERQGSPNFEAKNKAFEN